MSSSLLTRRLRVARGLEPGDLLLAGGQMVNVFTSRLERGDVLIADGVIAGVGSHRFEARETIDVSGAVIAPGLIDAHVHIESTLLAPAALAQVVVPRGTAALIADPHEIANVLGVRGVELMLRLSEGLPLDCFFMAPSCVPASSYEQAGAEIGAAEVQALLEHPRVLGLGEMMNVPGVLAAEAGPLGKIAAARRAGRAVDGHAPGLAGRDLMAYRAAGIDSDHECTSAEEAIERAGLGMLVQVREGSMARNLDAMLPAIARSELGEWCLCTDDILPADLLASGHLDGLLRRVVAAGVPGPEAIRHATLVPARHYRLPARGAVAPGFCADLSVFEDLQSFNAALVLHRGEVAARQGAYTFAGAAPEAPGENTVHLGPLAAEDFALPLAEARPSVIGIVPDQIITRHERREVRIEHGRFAFDPALDVALIACVHRHHGGGGLGVGLVGGLGLRRRGALGSSVGHDAHNLVIAGTEGADMLACARALEASGGGFVVVAEGTVRALLPLPVAGLMSRDRAEEVCRGLASLHEAAAALGCPLASPLGTLSFLALTVIPALRITDRGLFDVEKFQLLPPAPVSR